MVYAHSLKFVFGGIIGVRTYQPFQVLTASRKRKKWCERKVPIARTFKLQMQIQSNPIIF